MNIKVYKEYRFALGKLVATDTGKEYTFSISRNDRFYHAMEKHITKEKVEGLSYANIDDIYIEDKDKTFFDEKTFTLKAAMLVTDKNDYVQSYALTIKNVKLIANNVSTKSYDNGAWKLEMYDLELPWQTTIDIVEITD